MPGREPVIMPPNTEADKERLFAAVDEFAALMKEKLDLKRAPSRTFDSEGT